MQIKDGDPDVTEHVSILEEECFNPRNTFDFKGYTSVYDDFYRLPSLKALEKGTSFNRLQGLKDPQLLRMSIKNLSSAGSLLGKAPLSLHSNFIKTLFIEAFIDDLKRCLIIL